MREAVARVTHAVSNCAPSAGSGTWECRYSILVRPEGGDLGEDLWALRLTPGPDGTLHSVSLRRWKVGMPSFLHEP
jgi:hypothetical protein